jgi:hypothetical protein
MTQAQCIPLVLAGLIAVGVGTSAWPADRESAGRTNRAELRELLKDFSPEERAALIQSWREKHGAAPITSEDIDQLRLEWRSLAPAEREAKLKEAREKRGPGTSAREDREKRREEWEKLPPAERRAKAREWRQRSGSTNELTTAERDAWRKQLRERLDAQLAGLREKKTNGTLTEPEQGRLDRLEELARRMEQGKRPAPSQPEGPPGEGRPKPPVVK